MSRRNARRLGASIAGNILVLALGCAGGAADGPGVPVKGKVLVDGEPLRTGAVVFVPDLKKGNRSAVRPAGQIDEQGSYTLSAEGKRNIPLGWYQVVVQAFEPPAQEGRSLRSLRGRGRTLVNSIYGRPETSGLSVEVVEQAGADSYDLNLKR